MNTWESNCSTDVDEDCKIVNESTKLVTPKVNFQYNLIAENREVLEYSSIKPHGFWPA